MSKRDVRLDCLRGIAVLMVLVHHSPTSLGGRLRAGWTGVDLFFVLSGFLVSGLLFKEHLAMGRIHPWRFYLRRGFKIYPNFYVMLCVTAALQASIGPPLVPSLVFHDAVFLQNYLGPWWGHTWSLAVEEHFYLLLPPALLLLVSSARFRQAPLRWTATLVAALGLALLAWRSWLVSRGATSADVLFKTHLRLDSLAFGVLLSVLWHFAPEHVALVRQHRRALLVAGLLLTLPAYILPYEHPFILSGGLTMLYVGYGLVLAATLAAPPRPAGAAARALALVGFHSYSIYLWHLPVRFLLAWLGWPPASTVLYFVGGPFVGMLMAKAVELPTLRLRDRWFPASTLRCAPPEPTLPFVRGIRLLAPAVLALVVAGAGHLLLVTAARRAGADPERNRIWVRADSRSHLDAAARALAASTDGSTGVTGYFPAYPAAIRLVGRLFSLRPVPAGRLAAAGALVGLLLVIALLLPDVGTVRRALALSLAALLPGFAWWHMVLPLSTVTALSLAAAALGSRGRFVAAGVCGAAAALTHPVGFLVVVPVAMTASSRPSRQGRASALLAGIGPTAVVVLLAIATTGLGAGGWDTWLLAVATKDLPSVGNEPGSHIALALQSLLVATLVALAGLSWFWHRRASPAVEAALLAHSAAVGVFAFLAGPEMRMQLQACALVGLVPLLSRLRLVAIALLLAASTGLAWWLLPRFCAAATR